MADASISSHDSEEDPFMGDVFPDCLITTDVLLEYKVLPIKLSLFKFPEVLTVDCVTKIWIASHALRTLTRESGEVNITNFINPITINFDPMPLDHIRSFYCGFISAGHEVVAKVLGDLVDSTVPMKLAVEAHIKNLVPGRQIDWTGFVEPEPVEFFGKWLAPISKGYKSPVSFKKSTAEMVLVGVEVRRSIEASAGKCVEKDYIAPPPPVPNPEIATNNPKKKQPRKQTERRITPGECRQPPRSTNPPVDPRLSVSKYIDYVKSVLVNYRNNFFSDSIIQQFCTTKAYLDGGIMLIKEQAFLADPAITITEINDFVCAQIRSTGFCSATEGGAEMLEMRAIRESVEEIRRIPSQVNYKLDSVVRATDQILQLVKSGVIGPVSRLDPSKLTTVVPVEKPLRPVADETRTGKPSTKPSIAPHYSEPLD
ncbi:putative glycoprotein 1 [Anopheles marajoara virus]|uniref:Glycoprotein 1 n=1 Tax=Anopheles marajoara virus TaxID=2546225 RepID=A0AAE5YFN2_9MONO|nr:putative glycoprotein 1 [Anopheles marajoara virus]QBK47213.1 putative glycoprotein 1 [Anopheles marajoara virus]